MNNYFLEYYDKVRSGEILVGKELRKTLDNLYKDLANPRYFFDLRPGSIRIDFIETFCKHTKSPFTGQPFKLTLWEKAFLQVSYGFKMSDTKLRRFNEVILLIARKNGKTTFIAGIDLAEFFLSRGVDIVCASNTSEQANILFDEINNMREASPMLEKRTSKNIFCIKFGKKNDKRSSLNKSKIKKMSAQSKNKDGYNIEVGCIDEVHEMTDSKVYDAIKQSQSTKKEPLIFIITTEGVTVGGFLDSKLEYARKIIKGEIEDERVLPWLYTQDSQEEIFNDPKTWIKSNPSLGEIKQVSYLEDLMNKSKNDLATRVTMLCKDFNIKQTEDGSWLNFKDIENKDTFDIEDLRGSYAIGGVDLSSTTDLTAAVLYVEKQGKKYLISHFFMPSDVLNERIQEDNVPYDIWVEKGYITLTEGSQNDFSLVTQWFRSMIDKYDIRPLWVGYDPWRNHALNYNNNPIIKWCLANTQAKVDVNGNIQPSKLNSRLRRIDGTVATIIAYATLTRYKLDYESMTK